MQNCCPPFWLLLLLQLIGRAKVRSSVQLILKSASPTADHCGGRRASRVFEPSSINADGARARFRPESNRHFIRGLSSAAGQSSALNGTELIMQRRQQVAANRPVYGADCRSGSEWARPGRGWFSRVDAVSSGPESRVRLSTLLANDLRANTRLLLASVSRSDRSTGQRHSA